MVEVMSVIWRLYVSTRTVLLFPSMPSSRGGEKSARLALAHEVLHILQHVQKVSRMPTLFRFLFFCVTAAAAVYGLMFALVVFVEPRERDVVVRIPSERVNPQNP
ncbi:hypothetical protein [Ciceribacter sp. L1K22]|uniref:hypothetical protein n=2 Tax=unclassified Ciceribacter TaxID=2628820 RepID=UPI001ABDB0F9|nr:hypothetical protein [Ciceribacter sp. L1K22]